MNRVESPNSIFRILDLDISHFLELLQLDRQQDLSAILYTESESVGKILNTRYVSGKIAYDLPTDKTLKVVSNIPQILDVDTLASFDHIGISSNGRNYLIAPDLVVLDGFTNELIPEIDIRYTLGDQKVKIFTNTYNLHFTEPRIIPTNNSNGAGISSAIYNPSDKTGSDLLLTDILTANFPFQVNDEIMIENTSVGVGSTGTGYNSSDYSYTFFRVVEIDPNIGGSNGSLKFDMSEVIVEGSVPGQYDVPIQSEEQFLFLLSQSLNQLFLRMTSLLVRRL